MTGPGAEYTIADPTGEASVGFADRDAISPLQQLKAFTGNAGAFTYVPANSPSGEPVPSSALSDSATSVTGHLDRTTGPGAPATDSSLDFTTASGNGQLAPGSYTWTGYVYVPASDTYKFRFQFSSAIPTANVTFALDGTTQTLGKAENVYGNGVTSAHGAALPGTPTDTGYTEAGLTNVVTPAASPDRRHVPPGHDYLQQRHGRPGELPVRLLHGPTATSPTRRRRPRARSWRSSSSTTSAPPPPSRTPTAPPRRRSPPRSR